MKEEGVSVEGAAWVTSWSKAGWLGEWLPWSSGTLETLRCPELLRICVLGIRSSQGLSGFLSARQASCQVAWKFGRRSAKLLAPFQMGCWTAGNLDAKASQQPTVLVAEKPGRGKKGWNLWYKALCFLSDLGWNGARSVRYLNFELAVLTLSLF